MKVFRLPFFVALALITLAGSVFAQGKITVEKTVHDFGTFNEGEPAEFTFVFKNEGDGELLVTSVEPSCGCTVPKWSQDPVQAGESGEIQIEYSSIGRPGQFRKSIRVMTDGDPAMVVLYIEGTVIPITIADAESIGSLDFESIVTDLGEVVPGQIRKLIPVVNTSDLPIRISETRISDTSLSLVVPSYPIFGGERELFDLFIDTSGLAVGESFDIEVTLVTNDASQPEKSIRFKGQIVSPEGE